MKVIFHYFRYLICCIMLTSGINSSGMGHLRNGIKRMVNGTYKLFKNYNSGDFVKDSISAYSLKMGLVLMHELGHAVTKKILFGSPIDITLGTSNLDKSENPYLQLGGIKLGGFNPYVGFSSSSREDAEGLVLDRIEELDNGSTAYYYKPMSPPEIHRRKRIAVLAAGPICGALSSIIAYNFLKKYNKLKICKFVLIDFFISQTICQPLGLRHPNSDISKIVNLLRS